MSLVACASCPGGALVRRLISRRLTQRASRKLKPRKLTPSEKAKAADAKIAAAASPPYLVRVGLVGTTVAVATPVFPAVIFVRAVNYLVPRSYRVVLFGGFGCVVAMALRDVLPWCFNNADIFAPVALANGCVASLFYGIMDACAGILIPTQDCLGACMENNQEVTRTTPRAPVPRHLNFNCRWTTGFDRKIHRCSGVATHPNDVRYPQPGRCCHDSVRL